MNDFTKCHHTDSFGFSEARYDRDSGNVTVSGKTVCRVYPQDLQGRVLTEQADGELIAAAFTAGTLVNHEGVNMIKALKHLPRMISFLDSLEDNDDTKHLVKDLLNDLRS